MPFEALRRTTRDRKYVLEEIEKVFPRLQQLQKEGLTAAEQAATINSLVEHLQAQKQKVTAVSHIDFADTAVVQACGVYCGTWKTSTLWLALFMLGSTVLLWQAECRCSTDHPACLYGVETWTLV